MFRVYEVPELTANRRGENWIQGAIKHPGALRKAAKVKAGQKISAKKLTKLAQSKNPLTRKRANLAKTLKKLAQRRKKK